MSGIWLVSYVVLWLIVIGLVLVILALSREIEALHARLDSVHKFISRTDSDSTVNEHSNAVRESQTPDSSQIIEK
jgi:predicted Holliday junction resolvase-like endonuclease